METIKVEKDGDVAELVKCKTDEILFVRYDPQKDADATSELIQELLKCCQELEIPCLVLPKSDEDVYLEFEQWDVERLRKFDNKLQEMIKKKSPLILQ